MTNSPAYLYPVFDEQQGFLVEFDDRACELISFRYWRDECDRICVGIYYSPYIPYNKDRHWEYADEVNAPYDEFDDLDVPEGCMYLCEHYDWAEISLLQVMCDEFHLAEDLDETVYLDGAAYSLIRFTDKFFECIQECPPEPLWREMRYLDIERA